MRSESIFSPAIGVLRCARLLIVMVAICSLFALSAAKPASTHVSRTPSPSPMVLSSLFEGDICAPPCWFGLTPGESTTEDVIAMFQANEGLFMVNPEVQGDIVVPNLEPLLAGSSSTFVWLEGSQNILGGESHIVLDQGILDWMRIQMNRDVSLYQTLATFGQPNYIRVTLSVDLFLILFYPELNMIVRLRADPRDCDLSNLSEDYLVSQIYYYSLDSFETLEQGLAFDRWIPLPIETWEMWLRGEPGGSCIDVLEAFLASIDVTRTPTAIPNRSLFPDDTCTPPCWFGLTPGQTTAQEILNFIETSEDQFLWHDTSLSSTFSDTGYMINGSYYFYWLGAPYSQNINLPTSNNTLVLHQGLLYSVG